MDYAVCHFAEFIEDIFFCSKTFFNLPVVIVSPSGVRMGTFFCLIINLISKSGIFWIYTIDGQVTANSHQTASANILTNKFPYPNRVWGIFYSSGNALSKSISVYLRVPSWKAFIAIFLIFDCI